MTDLHTLEQHHDFIRRHIGPNQADISAMLATIGSDSLSQLIDETVPANILQQNPLNLAESCSEQQALNHL
ncbi:MAG TPA: hypothetical protein ENK78_07615, partial [Thiothrix sp.]|nr:hypothetical protein [Thiothrix sp.]